MYFPLFVGVLCLSLFCFALLCVLSSFAIILKRKRKLVALLLLSYRCIVTINVLCLFLTVPWFGLQCVVVVIPQHTHFFCHRLKDQGLVACALTYILQLIKPQELEVRSLNHPYSLKTKSSQCHYVVMTRSETKFQAPLNRRYQEVLAKTEHLTIKTMSTGHGRHG